jgi:hypothetical protein
MTSCRRQLLAQADQGQLPQFSREWILEVNNDPFATESFVDSLPSRPMTFDEIID